MGDVTIVPIFQLYDYSCRVPGADTREQSLRRAYAAGVVRTGEGMLHPDPYPNREAWCWERVAATRKRLDALARRALACLALQPERE